MACLSGCGEHPQSALHPAGAAAETIAGLWWFLFAVLTTVFVLTLLLMLLAIVRRPRPDARPSPMSGVTFVVIAGLIVPAIIVTVLLLATMQVGARLKDPTDPQTLTIRIIGHRWWWEVHYPQLGIVSANQIRIPVGEPVRLELSSADVIHSFWVPNLAGKTDLLPDHIITTWLQADRAGVYHGQCAEYCGLQHALMAFRVIAMPAEEFRAWAEARRDAPAVSPEPDPLLERGRAVFFGDEAGCYTCHVIRGERAGGNIGPDLTFLGTRLTLGAGTIPNTPENLAAWILDPQSIKPGNRMPGTVIAPEDLEALVEYLMSLQ